MCGIKKEALGEEKIKEVEKIISLGRVEGYISRWFLREIERGHTSS